MYGFTVIVLLVEGQRETLSTTQQMMIQLECYDYENGMIKYYKLVSDTMILLNR